MLLASGLVAVLVVVWFVLDSLGAREAANASASAHCKRLGLQFLDGTVAFARIGLTPRLAGGPGLRREFTFDFSANGMTRMQGLVTVDGRRVQAVDLPPDAY